ncbi:MAG: hypothetical protein KA473_14350 [Anaerolineales bacterium]|nr:hypothetical protein [Anaerolineales bacterium]
MKKISRFFLIVFVLSSVSGLMFLTLKMGAGEFVPTTQVPGADPGPTPGDSGEVEPSPQGSRDAGSIALAGSIITSITSLVGFVTTTVITWRKEKRDASLADVERKKLETELEKSRLELEELKENQARRKNKK